LTNFVKGAERAHYRALRDAAIERGEKTYMGYPCQNGHDGLRFTSGKGACVQCHYAWRRRGHKKRGPKPQKARVIALDKGRKHFQGRPCKYGHSGMRFTSSGCCVTCTVQRASERQKRVGHTERQKAQIAAWHTKNYNKTMWNSARNRAVKAGLQFTIEPEDIIIPEVCPVLGIPLVPGGGRENKNNSPSLDRFDNTKGYTKENIRVISWRANSLKSNGTLEEMQAIVAYMQGNLATQSESPVQLRLVA
jgi:hypothetical protein